MKILIRVDAKRQIGLGHLSRCLSIADELIKQKVDCFFITRFNSANSIILKNGFKSQIIPKNVNEISFLKKYFLENHFQGLILDTKRYSAIKLGELFYNKTKIITIDNYKIKSHLIILPGFPEQFTKTSKNSLIGSKYILIHPDFKKKLKSKQKNLIVITMGGSDKRNITTKIVSSLKLRNENFNVIVIVGKFNSQYSKLKDLISDDNRFKLFHEPTNYVNLIKISSIAVLAFGISVYELAAIGLKPYVISHSEENHKAALRIKKYGFFNYVGKYNKINYKKLSEKLISDFTTQIEIKSKNKVFIDTMGAKRVSDKIVKLIKND